MIPAVTIVSLALSIGNWLFFVAAVVIENLSRIRSALYATTPPTEAPGDDAIKSRARIDPIITATGGLATSLKSAGPAATAAALSFACLLVAVIAAGVDKL